MSIDKDERRGQGSTLFSLRLFPSIGELFAALIIFTPIIGLLAIVWAIELGVIVRVFQEAYDWGHDLLF